MGNAEAYPISTMDKNSNHIDDTSKHKSNNFKALNYNPHHVKSMNANEDHIEVSKEKANEYRGSGDDNKPLGPYISVFTIAHDDTGEIGFGASTLNSSHTSAYNNNVHSLASSHQSKKRGVCFTPDTIDNEFAAKKYQNEEFELKKELYKARHSPSLVQKYQVHLDNGSAFGTATHVPQEHVVNPQTEVNGITNITDGHTNGDVKTAEPIDTKPNTKYEKEVTKMVSKYRRRKICITTVIVMLFVAALVATVALLVVRFGKKQS